MIELKLILRNIVSTKIPNIHLDGILIYNKIEEILNQAKSGKKPFPETFHRLKKAGVSHYEVEFAEFYNAKYYGTFGTWQERTPAEYRSIKTSGVFDKNGMGLAITNHIQNQTHFVQFLEDIAKCDCSKYVVCMKKNTVRYYSSDSIQYKEERVPEWRE